MATDRYIVAFSATGLSDVTSAFDRLNSSVITTRDVMALARNALVGLAAVQALSGITDLIDAFTNMQNKLKIVTNNTDELNAVQANLASISNQTRQSLESTTDLFFRLTRSTGAQKLSYQDLLDITKEVNQALLISGATTTEAKNAIVQFGQGLALGTLRGQDLRSVVEQVPALADAIGRHLKDAGLAANIAGGSLKSFADANKNILTTKVVIDALRAAMGEFAGTAAKTQPTIAQGFERLKTALILVLGGMNQATEGTKLFGQAIDFVIDHLGELIVAFALLAGITVFNILTSQLVTFGSTLAGFVGFATSGFVNLARVMLFPVQAVVGLGSAFVSLSGIIGSTVIAAWGTLSTVVTTTFGVISRFATLTVFFGQALLEAGVGVVELGGLMLKSLGVAIWSAITAGIEGVLGAVLSLAATMLPFVIGAAVVVGALVAAWILFKDQIIAIIPSMAEVKKAFNDIAAYGVSAVQTLIDDWRLFPDALADLMIQAANGAIAELEKFVNFASGALNHLLPKSLEIPKIDVNTDTINNSFAGAADKIGKTFDDHLQANLNTDWGQKIVDTAKNVVTTVNGFVKPALGGLDLSKLFPNVSTLGAGQAVDQLKGKLKSLLESISPLIKDSLTLADAQKAVAAGANEIAKAGLTQEEVMRRVERSVLGAGNAMTDASEKLQLLKKGLADKSIDQNEYDKLSKSIYGFDTAAEDAKQKQDLLTAGFKAGVIDINTYNDAWQKLQSTMLVSNNPQDPFAGMQAGLLDLQQSYQDVAKGMQDATKKAFDGMTSQLSDFIVKGKADFGSLAESIESDLVNIALKGAIEAPFLQAINGALGNSTNSTGSFFGDLFSSQTSGSKSAIGDIGSLFSSGSTATSAAANVTAGAAGGGGWLSGIGSWIGGMFADGGEFQVGGQGGTDSQLVAFRASPDETVSITKPGQRAQPMQNKQEVHLHIYGVQDADSFQRSRSQVEAAVGVGINRAIQRNTQAKSKQARQ